MYNMRIKDSRNILRRRLTYWRSTSYSGLIRSCSVHLVYIQMEFHRLLRWEVSIYDFHLKRWVHPFQPLTAIFVKSLYLSANRIRQCSSCSFFVEIGLLQWLKSDRIVNTRLDFNGSYFIYFITSAYKNTVMTYY